MAYATQEGGSGVPKRLFIEKLSTKDITTKDLEDSEISVNVCDPHRVMIIGHGTGVIWEYDPGERDSKGGRLEITMRKEPCPEVSIDGCLVTIYMGKLSLQKRYD